MAYAHITNLWASLAEPLILEQYKESPNLKALIKIFVDAGQSFEDAADRLRSFYNIDTATGSILDAIGSLRNVARNLGEKDSDYKARIIEDIAVQNSGTPNYLIYMAKKKSQDPAPKYLEEEGTDDPTVFIYTPAGRQLERAFVARNTPAGVSGFPGASICFEDGSAIMDAAGKKFLCVAEDDQIGTDLQKYVITENGLRVLTEAGEMLLTEGEDN